MKTKAVITIIHDTKTGEVTAKAAFSPSVTNKQDHPAATVAMEAMKAIAEMGKRHEA